MEFEIYMPCEPDWLCDSLLVFLRFCLSLAYSGLFILFTKNILKFSALRESAIAVRSHSPNGKTINLSRNLSLG